jgi:hypothetical protein
MFAQTKRVVAASAPVSLWSHGPDQRIQKPLRLDGGVAEQDASWES